MKQSFFKKTGMIAVLIILLNIPLGVILGIIQERSAWNDQARRQIASTWGAPQNIAGPVLTIPFYDTDGNLQYASFLADTLDINADITPEKRYRGIFEVIVYGARISMSGTFARPDFSAWNIEPYQILWDRAALHLGISDLRAVQEINTFQWNSKPATLKPGEKSMKGIRGLTARLFPGNGRDDAGLQEQAHKEFVNTNQFTIVFRVHGSRQIQFAPAADTTRVAVTSPWPHPSFRGDYLPAQRTITQEGFTASWQVSGFGRDYPGMWHSAQKNSAGYTSCFSSGLFGVELIQPVNFYTLSERSVKYGLLIIGLTFLCFFMFEILNQLKIHPMQYLLVGFSLSLFYLLLISFAEHIGFLPAYILSAGACVILITWYTRSFLINRRASLLTAGVLTGFFSLFYVILQHEGYSLVMGSSSLFFILALVMWLTRKLDWYTVFKSGAGFRLPFRKPQKAAVPLESANLK